MRSAHVALAHPLRRAAVLQEMRGALPAGIAVPASVALPFGTFERVLADAANANTARAIAAAQKELVTSCWTPT